MINNNPNVPICTSISRARSLQLMGMILMGLLGLNVFLRKYVLFGKETYQIPSLVPLLLCIYLLFLIFGTAMSRRRVYISQTEVSVGKVFGHPLRVQWDDIGSVRIERSSLMGDMIIVSLANGKDVTIKLICFPINCRSLVCARFVEKISDSASVSKLLLDKYELPKCSEKDLERRRGYMSRGGLLGSIMLGSLFLLINYFLGLVIFFLVFIPLAGGDIKQFINIFSFDSLLIIPLCGSVGSLIGTIQNGTFGAISELFYGAMRSSRKT